MAHFNREKSLGHFAIGTHVSCDMSLHVAYPYHSHFGTWIKHIRYSAYVLDKLLGCKLYQLIVISWNSATITEISVTGIKNRYKTGLSRFKFG